MPIVGIETDKPIALAIQNDWLSRMTMAKINAPSTRTFDPNLIIARNIFKAEPFKRPPLEKVFDVPNETHIR
jgi:hypothetical protein